MRLGMEWVSLSFGVVVTGVLSGATACGDTLADDSTSVILRVDAVTPQRVPARGGAEIQLLGDNFASNLSVTLDGESPLAITWHGPTRVTLVTHAGRPGPRTLRVRNPTGPGVELAGAVRYYADDLAFAGGHVLLPAAAMTNWAPGRTLFGDLDGDGHDDLVVHDEVNYGVERTHNTARIFLSRGVGEALEHMATLDLLIDAATSFPSVRDEQLRALSDVDGDGLADLISTHGLRLAAANTFAALVPFPAPLDPQPDLVIVADFDGDGAHEIFASTPLMFGVVFELSGGTLVPGVSIPLPPLAFAAAAARDVNGDGAADLVHVAQGNALRVLYGPSLGDSGEWLGGALPCPRAACGMQVELADADGDGLEDVVATNGYALYAYGALADGTFAEPMERGAACPVGAFHEGLISAPRKAGADGRARNLADRHDTTLVKCRDGSVGAINWEGRDSQGAQVTPGSARVLGAGDVDGDARADLVAVSTAGLVAFLGTYNYHPTFSPFWGLPMHRPGADSFAVPRSTRGRFGVAGGIAFTHHDRVVVTASAPSAMALVAEVILALPPGASTGSVDACDLDLDGDDDLVVEIEPGVGYADALQVLYLDDTALRVGELLQGPVRQTMLNDGRVFLDDFDGRGGCDIFWVYPHEGRALAWLSGPAGAEREIAFVAGDTAASTCGSLAWSMACKSLVRTQDLDGDGDLDLYRMLADNRVGLWWNEDIASDATPGFRFEARPLAAPAGWAAHDLAFTSDAGEAWVIGVPRPGSVVAARAAATAQGYAVQTASPVVAADLGTRAQVRLADVDGDGMLDVVAVPGIAEAADAILFSVRNDGGAQAVVFPTVPSGDFAVARVVDLLRFAPAFPTMWFSIDVLDFDGDGLDDFSYQSAWLGGRAVFRRNESE